MRVLGMLDAAYWGSWFTTHIIILMVSGALCAFIGQYVTTLLLCAELLDAPVLLCVS